MKLLGEVREFMKDDKYPSIKEMINRPMENDVKIKVVEYLKTGKELAVSPSLVRDIFNPEIRLPRLSLMGDGEYKWSSRIIYYVEKYDLELPQEFIEHVLEKMK
jgi:hypothetical protein